MRLFALVSITMIAFAANSLLNRAALAGGGIGPGAFAAIRLAAGAGMLWALAAARGGGLAAAGPLRAGPAAALLVYMLGFSWAYSTLDAGLGALILFGVVQATMVAGAVISREAITARRWAGAAVAYGGLAVLLWPSGAAAPDLGGAVLMALAGIGWGVFSLQGRGLRAPLATTATAFVLAAPVAAAAALLRPDAVAPQAAGIALAVVSGAITSGLGYALWYSVLPRLGAARGAVAQLPVPVLAIAAGVVVLGEGLSVRLFAAGALVIGGVALSLTGRPR